MFIWVRLSRLVTRNPLDHTQQIMHIYQFPRGNWISQHSGFGSQEPKLFHEDLMGSLREKGEWDKGSGPGPGDLSHLPTAAFQRTPRRRKTPCEVWERWGIWTMAQWLMIVGKGQFWVWPAWSCEKSLSDTALGNQRKATTALPFSGTQLIRGSPTSNPTA